MSCDCTTYQCLTTIPDFSECPDTIELNLKATEDAVYTWLYEFNGLWFGGSVTVTNGENIVLPYVFNENYIHEIKFLNSDNELVNDTCYKLDTALIAGSYTNNTEGLKNVFTVTVENDGTTLTNAMINNRTVETLITSNQAYNSDQFSQSGNTITLTNGGSFYAGQVVTITIKH